MDTVVLHNDSEVLTPQEEQEHSSTVKSTLNYVMEQLNS